MILVVIVSCFSDRRCARVCHPSDCQGHLVVLRFEVVGAAWHHRLHSSQEVQSSIIPAHLSSCFHVLAVVDRSQVGRRRNVYVLSLNLSTRPPGQNGGQSRNVLSVCPSVTKLVNTIFWQEAQLLLTKRTTLFCKVVEVLQDFLSENVDKKFTTDYNVALVAQCSGTHGTDESLNRGVADLQLASRLNLKYLRRFIFLPFLPHFCFPLGRPWGNHGKCCMDGKRIRCLQIVSQHVCIYLQQFPSYSNRKCKKSPFSRTAACFPN